MCAVGVVCLPQAVSSWTGTWLFPAGVQSPRTVAGPGERDEGGRQEVGEPGRRNHRARKGILAWRWGRAPEPRASHELLGGGPAGRWRCALGVAGGAGPAESPPPAAPSPHRLLSLRSCSRSPAPSRSPGRGPLVCAAPPPAPPPPLATMAHWGPSRAPKGTGGPTARAPSPGAPPPLRSPRLRPLLLLLLLLLGTCGAAWRSPEPGRLGPHAELTRAPRSPPAESGGSEDRQARGTEPGAPGPSPGPAPGPGEEDGATATGYRRWERAAPLAGVASRAQVSLISTSFVLKGDATHNQAMVHWTGENSSVILILTKYYHADMGKVLESSLWR
nr:VPS10 domain-containing receptor SorCS2-like [Chlorocebus sabaeus]